MREIFQILLLGLKTIPRRIGTSLVTVIGVAGVVAVFISIMSISQGFEKTLSMGLSDNNIIIMRKGATSEINSIINAESFNILRSFDGLAKNEEGALISGERYSIVELTRKSSDSLANVPLRGVESQATKIRDKFSLIEGRMFKPGLNEIIAGIGVSSQYKNVEVGNKLKTGETEWLVVGIFEVDGGVAESELWADKNSVDMGSNIVSVVTAKLVDANEFEKFTGLVTQDPRLSVDVKFESSYYAEQSEILLMIVSTVGYSIALLMTLGAIFSSINTMESAISVRRKEIIILKTLGFNSKSVVGSVLIENMLLSSVGALFGSFFAYMFFNGYTVSTMNPSGAFSQVVFSFAIDSSLVIKGIAVALVIGFVGALLPALNATKISIVNAR